MVEVVCDSSFLMILASKRIKNISTIDTDIGSLEFIVPDMVHDELKRIAESNSKKKAKHKRHLQYPTVLKE